MPVVGLLYDTCVPVPVPFVVVAVAPVFESVYVVCFEVSAPWGPVLALLVVVFVTPVCALVVVVCRCAPVPPSVFSPSVTVELTDDPPLPVAETLEL